MRRALAVLVAIAGLAAPAQAGTPAPSRLLVTADEWSIVLSRQALTRGEAIVELRNAGEDAHDLRLRRKGRKRVITMSEVAPGDLGRVSARLRRGRWTLWCSLPGHAELGMRARLRVRRR